MEESMRLIIRFGFPSEKGNRFCIVLDRELSAQVINTHKIKSIASYRFYNHDFLCRSAASSRGRRRICLVGIFQQVLKSGVSGTIYIQSVAVFEPVSPSRLNIQRIFHFYSVAHYQSDLIQCVSSKLYAL